MPVPPVRPIVVRIFEPISFVFQEGAMPQPLYATVPPPNCILCDGPAAPPSRMGWLQAPDRQAVFVCCGSCSNCSDAELETKIVAQITCILPETSVPAAPAEEKTPTPVKALAAATTKHIDAPLMAAEDRAPATWVAAAARE